jgi:hypothetical protein
MVAVVLAIYFLKVIIIQMIDIIGVIQYAKSNIMGQRERGQLNQDHSLIQYVQQKTDIQDPEQAKENIHIML